MKGFVQDIEALAVGNADFRRVLYTAKHCQLVVMALKPKEEIQAKRNSVRHGMCGGCEGSCFGLRCCWSVPLAPRRS